MTDDPSPVPPAQSGPLWPKTPAATPPPQTPAAQDAATTEFSTEPAAVEPEPERAAEPKPEQATAIDLRPVDPSAAPGLAVRPPDEEDALGLRGVTFPLALRGYNTHAVDRYAAEVERCVALFEQNSSPTEAVRKALDRVGEQTAAILREAERAAAETTSASQTAADERIARAERDAEALWTAAQAKAKTLDNDIERLWQERERLIQATRGLADQLRTTADEAEAEFPPEPETPQTAPTKVQPPAPADEA